MIESTSWISYNTTRISADPSALPEGEAQGKREAWTACQLVPELLAS